MKCLFVKIEEGNFIRNNKLLFILLTAFLLNCNFILAQTSVSPKEQNSRLNDFMKDVNKEAKARSEKFQKGKGDKESNSADNKLNSSNQNSKKNTADKSSNAADNKFNTSKGSGANNCKEYRSLSTTAGTIIGAGVGGAAGGYIAGPAGATRGARLGALAGGVAGNAIGKKMQENCESAFAQQEKKKAEAKKNSTIQVQKSNFIYTPAKIEEDDLPPGTAIVN